MVFWLTSLILSKQTLQLYQQQTQEERDDISLDEWSVQSDLGSVLHQPDKQQYTRVQNPLTLASFTKGIWEREANTSFFENAFAAMRLATTRAENFDDFCHLWIEPRTTDELLTWNFEKYPQRSALWTSQFMSLCVWSRMPSLSPIAYPSCYKHLTF